MWDYSTAARVDTFVANSWNVRRRLWRVYRRRSSVLHPPVAVHTFDHKPSDGYFLMVSEMVAYKRLAYAVRAFAKSGRRLRIVGDGPEFRTLRKEAARNIEFCGRVSDEELRDLYARSAALVVPGEEDFGITMVESLASGKPVIALGRGGATEIVSDGCGVLFENPDELHLAEALKVFDAGEAGFDPGWLKIHASEYSEEVFETRFRSVIQRSPKHPSVLPAPLPATPAAIPIPIRQSTFLRRQ
jgi:glycosyltransferase involved in cell wall biosynthesis